MPRQITALAAVLASTLLSTVVVADNPIFGFSPSDPTCTACLDDAVASCPGFYQDRSVATCICGDGGSAAVVACTSNSCDPGVNSPANAGRMWYNYCTQFFPAELCPGAQEYMNPDIYQDQCSPEAIASGGLGSDGGGSGSGGTGGTGSGSSEDSETTSSPSVAGPTAPIRPTDTTSPITTSSSGTGTGTAESTSKPTKSSSANVAAIVPAWGVVLGPLGVVGGLVGMMM